MKKKKKKKNQNPETLKKKKNLVNWGVIYLYMCRGTISERD